MPLKLLKLVSDLSPTLLATKSVHAETSVLSTQK